MLFLCLVGVLLNIVFNMLISQIGLPLFLDTAGTIAITMLGGLFWGILCGALTNIVIHTISFWGWEGYLFAICNIATALVTWLFIRLFPRELSLDPKARKLSTAYVTTAERKSRRLGKMIDTVVVLILLSFCLCLAISILGGAISAFIQTHDPSYAGDPNISLVISGSMFSQNLSIAMKEMLSRIPMNIVDRLVSAFAGYGIALTLHRLCKGLKII
jgi:hypothetical protein